MLAEVTEDNPSDSEDEYEYGDARVKEMNTKILGATLDFESSDDEDFEEGEEEEEEEEEGDEEEEEELFRV